MIILSQEELRELLETAYIKGWDDSERGVLDDEYLDQKKAAVDVILKDAVEASPDKVYLVNEWAGIPESIWSDNDKADDHVAALNKGNGGDFASVAAYELNKADGYVRR